MPTIDARTLMPERVTSSPTTVTAPTASAPSARRSTPVGTMATRS
jgi:hypothetical protein